VTHPKRSYYYPYLPCLDFLNLPFITHYVDVSVAIKINNNLIIWYHFSRLNEPRRKPGSNVFVMTSNIHTKIQWFYDGVVGTSWEWPHTCKYCHSYCDSGYYHCSQNFAQEWFLALYVFCTFFIHFLQIILYINILYTYVADESNDKHILFNGLVDSFATVCG